MSHAPSTTSKAAAGGSGGIPTPLRFCCWNVNGISKPAKASAVAEELLRAGQYDVVGLIETHHSQADEWAMDASLAAQYELHSSRATARRPE